MGVCRRVFCCDLLSAVMGVVTGWYFAINFVFAVGMLEEGSLL